MRSMKRRTLAMDRRTYTTNWRTRRISVGPGLRNIGRDRWNVERVQRTVGRGAFPANAINGPLNACYETSEACDGALNAYDGSHREVTWQKRRRTPNRQTKIQCSSST